MEPMEFLKEFADKWQLNKKTVRALKGNKVVLEEDFLDLSWDMENLGLTNGQKNSPKKGVAIMKMTATMSAEIKEDAASKLSNGSNGNVSFNTEYDKDDLDGNSEKMGFIKSAFYLFLRYIFLGIIIAYNTVARMWQTMLTPFEPVRSAAKKVPEEEISLGGIFATLKRLAFIGLLVWATMVQSVLDRLLQPVFNVVENMSDFVERHSPENTSRLTKVE